MTESENDSALQAADALLKHYFFDGGEFTSDQLLDRWLRSYPPRWVRLALIEALYQGRYKAVSVEQILLRWLRRGQPTHRFSKDFESLVCNNLPKNLLLAPEPIKDQEPSIAHVSTSQATFQVSSLAATQSETGWTTMASSTPVPSPLPEASIQEFQPEHLASDFYTKLTEIARSWKPSNLGRASDHSRSL